MDILLDWHIRFFLIPHRKLIRELLKGSNNTKCFYDPIYLNFDTINFINLFSVC